MGSKSKCNTGDNLPKKKKKKWFQRCQAKEIELNIPQEGLLSLMQFSVEQNSFR